MKKYFTNIIILFILFLSSLWTTYGLTGTIFWYELIVWGMLLVTTIAIIAAKYDKALTLLYTVTILNMMIIYLNHYKNTEIMIPVITATIGIIMNN